MRVREWLDVIGVEMMIIEDYNTAFYLQHNIVSGKGEKKFLGKLYGMLVLMSSMSF